MRDHVAAVMQQRFYGNGLEGRNSTRTLIESRIWRNWYHFLNAVAYDTWQCGVEVKNIKCNTFTIGLNIRDIIHMLCTSGEPEVIGDLYHAK